MRYATRSMCLFALAFSVLLGLASTAAAESVIYDWSDEARPVLIENDTGIIFLSNEKEPDRVYRWDIENKGEDFDPVYMVDLGEEDGYEIVGSGNPMFVLQTNGDPLWSIDAGCTQTVVADFMGDGQDLEVLCQTGTDLKLYTNDGQRVWSVSLGAPIEECRIGDYDGDGNNDAECKYRGRDQWIRIGANGDIMAKSLEKPELSPGAPKIDEAEPVSADILKGEETFDLDGDGNDDEVLKADGKTLVIDSKAQDKPIAKVELDGEPEAALVKNLDGDDKNRLEIVAVTADTIHVMNHNGKKHRKFSASANDYKRVPHAALRSVYANGFEDDKKAKKVVRDLQDELSECYAGRVGQDKFTNTGRMLLRVHVKKDGSVDKVSRTHSDIKDKQIQQCAKKALSGGDYPAVSGENATINVKMKYTFRDE